MSLGYFGSSGQGLFKTVSGTSNIKANVLSITPANTTHTLLPTDSGKLINVASTAGLIITLPSATTAAEAADLIGWQVEIVMSLQPAVTNVTVVRADTGNDLLVGIVTSASTSNADVTIAAGVVTFVQGAADPGARVLIQCVAASATITSYVAHGVTQD